MTQRPDLDPPASAAPTARLVGGVAGFAFAAIGLTVLVFLWSASWHAWDSPPLFFRIFGSLIAIVFVVVGGALGETAVAGKPSGFSSASVSGASKREGHYRCTSCGAPLPSGVDVSPRGDLRCPYCKAWMNVHGAT